jgi:small multidrug resistance family-3 protein
VHAGKRSSGTAKLSSPTRVFLLFTAAALAEIAGAYLIWKAVKADAGIGSALLGMVLLSGYGFLASLQGDPQFGRVLAAYGGVFVAGSLLWGVTVDDFHPQSRDLVGAAICLTGAGIIMVGH